MSRERSGFSLASVLLSFLMICGGVSAAFLGLKYLELETSQAEHLVYLAFAAGGFVGGFFAARASRGSTVLEPALGALLVVGTLCGIALATPAGKMMWNLAQESITQRVLFVAGAGLVGSLIGAWLSERLLGESTRSSIPWILYVAIAVIGGCCMAYVTVVILSGFGDSSTLAGKLDGERAQQVTIFIGIGAGCLIAGLASGASARTRVLVAAFLGAAAGVVGFFMLVSHYRGSRFDNDTLIGLAVLGAGGGVLALLASALGWAAVGRRYA
jgi:hypothetical protein